MRGCLKPSIQELGLKVKKNKKKNFREKTHKDSDDFLLP